jgi:3-oxoacyl-[acyl-carrier-protein] synthase II
VKSSHAEEYLPEKNCAVWAGVPLPIAAAREALGHGISVKQSDLSAATRLGRNHRQRGGAPDFSEEQYRLFFSDPIRKVNAENVSSATLATISSEISRYCDIRGVSHVISTGCTSSTDALGYAFNMIRFGLADQLISGGVDATITPGIMQGFCIMKVVSTARNDTPAQASRPFDSSRDGFVLGEGAWLLVLEERERALERGATILGEILGYGSTCDAYHRVRLDPRGEEPARAMTLAIEDAGSPKTRSPTLRCMARQP